MKSNKLAAIALTAVMVVGGISTSVFATSEVGTQGKRLAAIEMNNEGIAAEDMTNEDYVKSLPVITEEEKAILLENCNKLDKLDAQIDSIYGDRDEISKEEEAKVEALSVQHEEICNKIIELERKALGEDYFTATDEEYVNSINGLTEEEKATLIETYAAMDKLEIQLEELYGDSDVLNEAGEKRAVEIDKELEQLKNKIASIESKISEK